MRQQQRDVSWDGGQILLNRLDQGGLDLFVDVLENGRCFAQARRPLGPDLRDLFEDTRRRSRAG